MQSIYLSNQSSGRLPVLKMLDRLDYLNRSLLFIGVDIQELIQSPVRNMDIMLLQKQHQDVKREVEVLLQEIALRTSKGYIAAIEVLDVAFVPAY